ncbi:MAG TPA: ABC transporter permease [Candidatus Sulfotelmatobacter sp.]|nr:ABC transporter permease [Candidatus Sulfotelmatobacter sp.]
MLDYAIRKFLHTALVALGVVTLAFAALRLSGDPAATMLPPEASLEELAALRHTLGLDQPIGTQYARFLASAVRGDFGLSFRHQQPALALVLERLPATLELAVAALALAVSAAIPLGILAAIYRGRLADVLAMGLAVVGQATPFFWLGIMLILVVSVQLAWLPTSGRGGLAHLILPAITLATHLAASLARLTRTSMLEILAENYLNTARAKGLGEWKVIWAHALKNAAIPITTLIGMQFGTLLGGSIVTEMIFAWPGVGRLAVQSIFARDYRRSSRICSPGRAS